MDVTLKDILAEIRNLSYLFYGYSVIWIIILGYVFTLSRREQNLRGQVEELRRTVDAEESDQSTVDSRQSPDRTGRSLSRDQ